MATSVNGPLTGLGGDFLILDDVLKPADALSETQRTAVNSWFDNTLLSRLNNKETGCIIIVMQRLHQDDLVGHVLEQDGWEVLTFPAIAEKEECHLIKSPFGTRYWRRNPGDVLDAARESLETIRGIEKKIGDYNFASQYQQDPTPLDGGMVKVGWLKYYEPGSEPGRFSCKVQSWDTANKAGELNDYSVCTTWGISGKDIYLLDVYRRKLNFPDLKRAAIDLRNRFRPNFVLIEDKASGTQLIQELKGMGLSVRDYRPPPSTDKQMRLHAQAIYFENGRIFLPEEAAWLSDYVKEITGFPGTRYDDQVDSTTQFLDHFGSRPMPLIIPEELLARTSGVGRYSRYSRRSRIPCFF